MAFLTFHRYGGVFVILGKIYDIGVCLWRAVVIVRSHAVRLAEVRVTRTVVRGDSHFTYRIYHSLGSGNLKVVV